MSTAAGGGKAPGGAQPTEAHAERAQARVVCVAPPLAGRRPGLTQLTPLVTACLQERSRVAAQREDDTAATEAAPGAAGGEATGAQLRQPVAAAAPNCQKPSLSATYAPYAAPPGPPTAPHLSELLQAALQHQDEHTEANARLLMQAAATPHQMPPEQIEAYMKQLEERQAADEDFLAVPGAREVFNGMLAGLGRGLQLNRQEMREQLTPSATHAPARQELDEATETDATVRALVSMWKRQDEWAAAQKQQAEGRGP